MKKIKKMKWNEEVEEEMAEQFVGRAETEAERVKAAVVAAAAAVTGVDAGAENGRGLRLLIWNAERAETERAAER